MARAALSTLSWLAMSPQQFQEFHPMGREGDLLADDNPQRAFSGAAGIGGLDENPMLSRNPQEFQWRHPFQSRGSACGKSLAAKCMWALGTRSDGKRNGDPGRAPKTCGPINARKRRFRQG